MLIIIIPKRINMPPKQQQKQKSSGSSLCQVVAVCCFLNLLLLALTVLVYGGLLLFPAGQEIIASTHCALQMPLALTPLADRGTLWHIQESLLSLFVALPLFALGAQGERMVLFDLYASVCGPIFPFHGGVAYANYDLVHGAMTKPQGRGHYIGATEMADECMGLRTLIFVSDGPEHGAGRALIAKAVPGFLVDINSPPPPIPEGHKRPRFGAPESDVLENLAATR